MSLQMFETDNKRRSSQGSSNSGEKKILTSEVKLGSMKEDKDKEISPEKKSHLSADSHDEIDK